MGLDGGSSDHAPSYASSPSGGLGVRFLAGAPPLLGAPGEELVGGAFLPALVASRGALSVLTYGPIAAHGADLFGASLFGGGGGGWDLTQLELEAPHVLHATSRRPGSALEADQGLDCRRDAGGLGSESDAGEDEEEEDEEDDEEALLQGGMAAQVSRKRAAHAKPASGSGARKPKAQRPAAGRLGSGLVAPTARACRQLEAKALALLARLLGAAALAPWRGASLAGMLDQSPSLNPGARMSDRMCTPRKKKRGRLS